MESKLHSLGRAAFSIFMLMAVGFFIYYLGVVRAAEGQFPMRDVAIPVLMIMWWWWQDPDAAFRGQSFQSLRLSDASAKLEEPQENDNGLLLKRILWSASSLAVHTFLLLRADAARGVAVAEPSVESLTQYGIASTVFVVFLLVWILFFPVVPREELTSLPSKVRIAISGVLATAGLVMVGLSTLWVRDLSRDQSAALIDRLQQFQSMLVWAGLLIYVFCVLKRVLPAIVARLASPLETANQAPPS